MRTSADAHDACDALGGHPEAERLVRTEHLLQGESHLVERHLHREQLIEPVEHEALRVDEAGEHQLQQTQRLA